ncbi:MAG: BBP7 family outer membrane beta-barrel protein [Planctomycetota bacterium]
MKLNKLLLSLSLAGLTFSPAVGQESTSSSTKHIGDGPAANVRTLGAEFEEALHSDVSSAGGVPRDTSSVQLASTRSISDAGVATVKHRVLSDSGASFAHTSDMAILAPTTMASHASDCTSCESLGCDGDCDSACGGGGGGMAKSNFFFGAEFLLWFTEDLHSPALVTSAPTGVLPRLGTPGVQTVFGGPDGIDMGVVPGFRTEFGMWIDNAKKAAVMGRAYGFSQNVSYQNSDTGANVSLGNPFFNPNTPGEDALLTAFMTPVGGRAWEGDISVRADVDLLGTEGSLKVLLTEGSGARFDLIGGYTYNRLISSLDIASRSTNFLVGDLIADGTVFDTRDVFATENEFHGGHLGLLSSVTRKGLTLSTLAKVSAGNMRNSSEISGYEIATLNNVSTPTAGGLYSQPSNIGRTSENNFSFITELGVKLGFNLNEKIRANVGYSMMYWSSAAMAGDQIDRVIDLTGALGRPARNLVTDGFWAQGLDFGFVYNY